MTTVNLQCVFDGESAELKCPTCGDGYTHHRIVRAYWRDAEDSLTGLIATSARGRRGCVATGEMTNNPSSRRDGVVIVFDCEGCKHSFALMVTQHKGMSFVTIEAELPARSPWLNECEVP